MKKPVLERGLKNTGLMSLINDSSKKKVERSDNSDFVASKDKVSMNSELERVWKDAAVI
jgi:hypothetical protein